MHRMPGQLDNLKSRKRKSNSRKASSTRKKTQRGTLAALETSSMVSGSSKERLSSISCECHQSAGRRRCSASPELEDLEGKENERKIGLDIDSCRVYSYKYATGFMDYEDDSKNMFPDDDSNQILPVEQFFGNLDALQDFPQRSSAASTCVQKGHRRRHYYAPEDSDEDEVDHSGVQQDHRGGTW